MNMSKDSHNLFLDEDNSSLVSEEWRTDWTTIASFSEPLNSTETFHNASNSTSETVDWKEPYTAALNILLLIMLITIMFTMGCEVKWKNLFNHIKKPIGLFVGMFCQFIILPFSAYCLLLLSGVQSFHATGVLIISCCPAGPFSNTFTYLCDGDLPLSIAMTTASTMIAMGMMPLNLWIYGQHFETDSLVIPYLKMALSLITVTSPTIAGMLMKWKLPKIAAFTTKVGVYLTVLIMAVCMALEVILFPNMFTDVPFKLYAVTLCLPAIGLTLGYVFATILKRSKPERKTIAIECGIQNVPVALTVITLSFSLEIQQEIVLLPWLYFFSMTSSCAVICSAYQLYKKYSRKNDTEAPDEELTKIEPLLEPLENGIRPTGVKIIKNGSTSLKTTTKYF